MNSTLFDSIIKKIIDCNNTKEIEYRVEISKGQTISLSLFGEKIKNLPDNVLGKIVSLKRSQDRYPNFHPKSTNAIFYFHYTTFQKQP